MPNFDEGVNHYTMQLSEVPRYHSSLTMTHQSHSQRVTQCLDSSSRLEVALVMVAIALAVVFLTRFLLSDIDGEVEAAQQAAAERKKDD